MRILGGGTLMGVRYDSAMIPVESGKVMFLGENGLGSISEEENEPEEDNCQNHQEKATEI